MPNIRRQLLRFALPWVAVAAVYDPLRYGWTRDAAEHLAMWSTVGIVGSILVGAVQTWRERNLSR